MGRNIPDRAAGLALCVLPGQAHIAQHVVIECGQITPLPAQAEQPENGMPERVWKSYGFAGRDAGDTVHGFNPL